MQQGAAIDHGSDGYPARFTVRADAVAPMLRTGPPAARAVWSSGPHDMILRGWEGKTVVDEAALAACAPDEWLLVEAWDES